MTHRIYSTCALVLGLAFPVVAFADASGTQALSANTIFNLDNSTVVTSGGDIKFTGTAITLVGSATAYNFGSGGATTYGFLSQTTLSSLALQPGNYTQAAITGSNNLAVGQVIAVHTNGGNYARMLVTALSSSSITFQYTTYGGTGGTPTPNITAVQDAGSYTSNIAQGSIFVVKGTTLSPSGYTQFGFPLPTSSSGVSIAFTPETGGSPTNAYLIYIFNENGVNQLAAVLPSTVATGLYNVTVTNGGATSSSVSVSVVARKPGLITADSSGNGLAVADNFTSSTAYAVDRFTTGTVQGSNVAPAQPGQTLVTVGTGLGGVPASLGGDNIASPGYNFLANGVTVQAIVGGMTLTPFYAGRAPNFAGLDQLDFVLPVNVPTGCAVPFQISVNGNMSQPTFLSIAPAGASACVYPGYTTAQLQAFDNGQITYSGNVAVSQQSSVSPFGSSVTEASTAQFLEYSGFELPGIPGGIPAITSGTCNLTQLPLPPAGQAAVGVGIALDAGALTLTGPNISSTPYTDTSNVYYASLGSQGGGQASSGAPLASGTYTINAAGGSGVGKFSTSMTLGTPFSVTGGLPTVVNRSSGLTLNWTGGNASDIVIISGSAYTLSSAGSIMSGAIFNCYTTAGAKTFTVGSSILNQLPAVTAAQVSSGAAVGGLTVNTSSGGTFSAPLTGGGSIANAGFGANFFFSGGASYQ